MIENEQQGEGATKENTEIVDIENVTVETSEDYAEASQKGTNEAS